MLTATQGNVCCMDKTNVIPLPLRAGPGLVYFKIGSKVFPLQFGYRSEQIARSPAKLLPFPKPESPATRSSPGTGPQAEEPSRA